MPKEENPSVEAVHSTVTRDIFHNAKVDLSSFHMESCTFEIRYPVALALWDKSGQVWTAIQEIWPEIKLLHAEPVKTTFQHGKSRLQIELEQARISTVDPDRALEKFSKATREFIRIVTEQLRISLYKRVGFRLVYFKEFKNRIEAAAAFLALNLLRVPEGKKFEIDSRPINPQYGLRWESDKKGLLLNCRAETRKLDVDPPPEAAEFMQPLHKETSGIVLDIDYYTVAPVEAGQLDAGEWLRHALHVISRDARYIFEVF